MSIRTYDFPRKVDLSPGLQSVLAKNGMQAHIVMTPTGGHKLVVMGHDSPVIEYGISEKQVEAMMNWGNNYANKKAYNTFNSIIGKDFDTPKDFVHARSAFGRVSGGLHGYRLGPGEYGFQPGWHMRRIGNRVFFPTSVMVPERLGGRIKPGEMTSGGYGYYYKGNRISREQTLDPQIQIQPRVKTPPARPTGQALPYSQEITSDVYFTKEKWNEVLKSHGIVVNEDAKTVTIKATGTRVDLEYDLTDEELKKLMAPHLEGRNGVSISDRLAVINNHEKFKEDFASGITKAMLESKDPVNMPMRPEAKEQYEREYIEHDRQMDELQRMADARREEVRQMTMEAERIRRDPNAINGREIGQIVPGKGFFNSVANGRQIIVGEIRVDKTAGDHYVMSAVINGEKVNHSISEKEYNKFLSLDDAHRLKLFDKKFPEVEIKNSDGRGIEDDMYATLENGRQVAKAHGQFRTVTDNARIDITDIQLIGPGHVSEKIQGMKNVSSEMLQTLNESHVIRATVNGVVVGRVLTAEEYNSLQQMNDTLRQQYILNNIPKVQKIVEEANKPRREYVTGEELAIEHAKANNVDGRTLETLNSKKGFYREGAHGREAEVGNIQVVPTQNGYRMTAVIDGTPISHDISEKEYNKFMAVDDMQRMKLFAKVFPEVDIKTHPGQGTNIGAAILAALTTAGAVAEDLARIRMFTPPFRGPGPHPYEGYYKPGVNAPADIAAANFELGHIIPEREDGIRRGI